MLNNTVLNDLSLYSKEFTLGRGNKACLLVHGFGCGPIQMRELAENIYKWGFTARGILLPGHCGDSGGFTPNFFHRWQEKVEQEYCQLKSEYKEVVVVGFSLGALLTLQLAIKYPLESIILMGIPMFIVREYLPINSLIRVCKMFMKKVKTRKIKCYMESEGYSGHLLQPIDTHFSLPALHGLTEIIKAVKPRLKEVKSPTLIIHSKKDLIAAPASASYVIKHLSSKDKRLVWLERSHHLVMYDKERDKVFRAIKEFLG